MVYEFGIRKRILFFSTITSTTMSSLGDPSTIWRAPWNPRPRAGTILISTPTRTPDLVLYLKFVYVPTTRTLVISTVALADEASERKHTARQTIDMSPLRSLSIGHDLAHWR